MLEVDGELDVERLVEPELLAQLRHVLGRRGARFAGEHVGRIAGREMQQREIEDDDGEDRGQRQRQAAQNVPQTLAGRRTARDSLEPPLLLEPGLVERRVHAERAHEPVVELLL